MAKRKLLQQVVRQYRNRVKECRLRALVGTQEELARRTRINRTIISALENNRLFLSAPYALVIAEALGCSLDDLYERTDGKPAPPKKQSPADDHRGYVAHT